MNVRFMFDQLLRSTVKQANVRVRAFYYLAVQLQDQPQHTVRRRVLWPEVHGEVFDFLRQLAFLQRKRAGLLPERGAHPVVRGNAERLPCNSVPRQKLLRGRGRRYTTDTRYHISRFGGGGCALDQFIQTYKNRLSNIMLSTLEKMARRRGAVAVCLFLSFGEA